MSWLDTRKNRSTLIQGVVLVVCVALGGLLVTNLVSNLEARGIASGFSFLGETAGFQISMHSISFDETSSYGRAFVVALLNTLLVSIVGIVGATVLGFTIGIARVSPNGLVRWLAGLYIELLRNLPLLLQIFFWYLAVLQQLPHPRQSLNFGDVFFLNVRGLFIPWPESGFAPWQSLVVLFIVAMSLYLFYQRLSSNGRSKNTSNQSIKSAIIVLLALAILFIAIPRTWLIPELKGFNFKGGLQIMPEFVALVIALSTYTASFIAEIVRAGLSSVPKGQYEAAYSLGLSRWQSYQLVVIPQALRIVIPPLTSQYLNLTKNSSLAAAIAFPDLVLVFAGTVLNQTGQAVEVILLTMAVYMTISLSISWLMNRYNQAIQIKER